MSQLNPTILNSYFLFPLYSTDDQNTFLSERLYDSKQRTKKKPIKLFVCMHFVKLMCIDAAIKEVILIARGRDTYKNRIE